MAYPNYELTWQFDSNRAFTPASTAEITQYQMWYIASFLLGYIGGATLGLWTLVGCSDGVSANMTGTWLWGTPGVFDPTKIVQVTTDPATTSHSWVILKSPALTGGAGGNSYILLSAAFSNTSGYSVWTSNATWTLNATPTFLPTSATITPNLSWAFTRQQANDATLGRHYIHGALATNGNWHVWEMRSGSNIYEFMEMWANTYQAHASDNYPFAHFRIYNNSPGAGWWTGNPFYNAGYNVNPCRRYDGTDQYFEQWYGWIISTTGTTATSGKELFSSATQPAYLLPCHVWVTNTITIVHARGRVQDWAFDMHATKKPNGYVYRDTGGVVRWILHGGVLVPFNTTPAC